VLNMSVKEEKKKNMVHNRKRVVPFFVGWAWYIIAGTSTVLAGSDLPASDMSERCGWRE
jgi:hypothetical protein